MAGVFTWASSKLLVLFGIDALTLKDTVPEPSVWKTPSLSLETMASFGTGLDLPRVTPSAISEVQV